MNSSEAVKMFAVEQVRGLEGQDFFRQNDVVLSNLVDALIEQATDQDHIKRMVATWINRTRLMLHPSDVPALAEETGNKPAVSPGCAACYWTGWKSGTRRVKVRLDEDTSVIREYDYVEPCDCLLGQKIAEAERERKLTGNRDGAKC